MHQGSKQWSGEMPGEDGSRGDEGELPCGPVVKPPHFQCRGRESDPEWENQDPTYRTVWPRNKNKLRNSLTVQWLRLHALTLEGLGSIPGLGTKIPQAKQCDGQNIKYKR